MINNQTLIDFVDEYLIPQIVTHMYFNHGDHVDKKQVCICCQNIASTPEEIKHDIDCVVSKWRHLKMFYPPPVVYEIKNLQSIMQVPYGDMSPAYCCGNVYVSWMNYRAHCEKCHSAEEDAQNGNGNE